MTKLTMDQVLPVVRDLVALKSENPGCGEAGVAEYVRDFFGKLDVPVTLVPIDEGRYNVVARMRGSGQAEPLAFTGHMDVVPVSGTERAKWKTDPYQPTVVDGKLFGRGATDMKGGLGAAMAAMRAIREEGLTPPGDILLIATVDEEALMLGSKAIAKTDRLSDVKQLVVCEPTDMQIICSGRGRSWADVRVIGESGHAGIENNGNNAIMQAMKLIGALKAGQHRVKFVPHPQLGNFFWQVTVIHGGVEPAVVPDSCVVTVDTRPIPGQTCDGVWDVFFEILNELKQDRDFDAEVEILERREPWETPVEDELVKKAEAALALENLPVEYGSANYTTDGCVFVKLGIREIIVGPGSISRAHKDNEWVDTAQLAQAANVYYDLMMGV